MRNAERRSADTAKQRSKCKAVAGNGFRRRLEPLHASHASLDEDRHLWRQRDADTA